MTQIPHVGLGPLLTVGGLLVSGAVLARLPDLAGLLFGKALDAALAQGDEADDELMLALVKWAEKKIPAPGSGSEKYRMVAHKAAQLWPGVDEGKLGDAIEKAVARMEAEADKREPPAK